tara:strand:+ start:1093 stop:1782 length:690 start_codon:yes stop_codon:yes gene_type:complete
MAKFDGMTCIMYAILVESGSSGLQAEEKERSRLVSKDKDNVLKSVRLGTTSEVSEINEKEVVSKDINADVHLSNPRIVKEYITEPIFDLFMDRISTGFAPNETLSIGICQNISLSEIKQLESNWSDGTSTNFSDDCRVSAEHGRPGRAGMTTISLYSAVDAINKADVIGDSTFQLGSLDSGTGSPGCAEDYDSILTLINDLSNVSNHPEGITTEKWSALLRNAHTINCG